MRLLLLGCTGFVGKELVPALLKEGHELCIISRKNINNLNYEELFDLEKLLNIDDTNLYNYNTGAKTDFEIENNKVNLLFKNFKY